MLLPGDGIEYPEYADSVKILEQFLKDVKLLPADRPVSGRFDSTVENAVRAFQKQHGLLVDGIVGAGTWAEIDDIMAALAKAAEQANVDPETLPVLSVGDGLERPDSRDEVRRLQSALQANRYFDRNEKIDGFFGHKTERTLKQFQADRGLPQTGTTTLDTWIALLGLPPREKPVRDMPTLRVGDGLQYIELIEQVKVLQEGLRREGFLDRNETIDGLFGSKTERAVKAFQRSKRLVADGIVGMETWSALLQMPIRAYTPERKGQVRMRYDIDKIVASIQIGRASCRERG